MKKLLYYTCLFCLSSRNVAAQQSTDTALITVRADHPLGNMKPIWAWFGYDEPNYTYMKDGKKLLSAIAALSPVPVHIRTHNLLTSGDGSPALKWGSTNAYTEDEKGNPVYSWTIVDSIFDTYVKRGLKPMAQMGFMPEALSTHPNPYRHHWQPGEDYRAIFTGWAYPPKSYEKWGELIYQWVKHCCERYGAAEVGTWYWELWNEPNGHGYWQGSVEEYCKLYDYSAAAVKRALPAAKVGGPHVTGPAGRESAAFLNFFLRHCTTGTNYVSGQTGAPLDFIAFHAKGAPRVVSNHVRMNAGQQLRDMDAGFAIVASFPTLRNLPIVIGESDPEGCAACGMATNPENAYRNGTMYSSYTAATFARKYLLADARQVNLLGAVSWSFEFEDQPWFFGYRDLATNGIGKPVLNIFRMFGLMSGKRIETSGSRMYPLSLIRDSSVRRGEDIGALAAQDKQQLTIMLWNYHDDDTTAPTVPVRLQLTGLRAGKVQVTEYRVDEEHGNTYSLWKKMGAPLHPSPAQVGIMTAGDRLEAVSSPAICTINNGWLHYSLSLPRQAVSLLKITWK